jgi:hypothetical protein
MLGAEYSEQSFLIRICGLLQIIRYVSTAPRDRYAQFPACETTYRWCRYMAGDFDNEDMGKTVLEDVGLHKVDIYICPKGFMSPLEIDRPLFLAKTLLLLEGKVRKTQVNMQCATQNARLFCSAVSVQQLLRGVFCS